MRPLPRLALALVLIAFPMAVRAQAPATKATKSSPSSKGGALVTDQDKTLYALGLTIGKSLDVFALTAAELEHVRAGIADAVLKAKPKAELETYGPRINALAQSRAGVKATEEKKKAIVFVEKMALEKGAEKLASGLVYFETIAGGGAMPVASDVVKVNYRGTLADGTEFDSSYKRGQPATFSLSEVVPCFSQGIGHMKVGGKAKLVCPPHLAYGDRGAPPDIPGGAALVFEIELLDIVKK